MQETKVRHWLSVHWNFGPARTNLEMPNSSEGYFKARWVLARHQENGDEPDFDQSKGVVQVPLLWYGRPKEQACDQIRQELLPLLIAGTFSRFTLAGNGCLLFYFIVPDGQDYRIAFCRRGLDVFEVLGISRTFFSCPKVEECTLILWAQKASWISTARMIMEEAETLATGIAVV